MPPRSDDVRSTLLNKFGFGLAGGKGDDHKWVELQLDGLPPVRTKVSHSSMEIAGELEGRISKQLRVRSPFFRAMIACSKSRQDYYGQIRSDPFPPFDQRIV